MAPIRIIRIRSLLTTSCIIVSRLIVNHLHSMKLYLRSRFEELDKTVRLLFQWIILCSGRGPQTSLGNFHGKFWLAPRRAGHDSTDPRLAWMQRMQLNLHPVYIMQTNALLVLRYLWEFRSPPFNRLSRFCVVNGFVLSAVEASQRNRSRLSTSRQIVPFREGAKPLDATRRRESHLPVSCSGKL